MRHAEAQRAGAEGSGDGAGVDDDEAASSGDETDTGSDAPRDSVVARLAKRLTEFVRTHEDTDDREGNMFLHNEDVDSAPENTGDAREAADTLRRRSRILGLARPAREDPGL